MHDSLKQHKVTDMTKREAKRSKRELTAEEREKLLKYREQIKRELPELRERAKQFESERREAAMLEPTISGQLRRAIADSGLDRRELAERVGVSGKAIAEFLIGMRCLDSQAIDKLGALLNQELKPIG